MGTQAVFVSGFGDGGAQQVRVFVHGLDRGAEQGEEDGVFLRAGTRVEQAAVTGRGEGPVVVLAGAVHAGEGLFMQQADHVMLVGGLAEHFHDQHVVVHGQVLAFKDGRNFKLAGRNFIVARFGRNAKFPEGFVHVHHEFQHAVLDGAEVVVFHLLVLGGDVAEEGAAAHHQVRAQGVKLLVHQEVFLLRAQIGADVDVGRAAEAGQQAPGLAGDGGHGAEKGSLFVQRLSLIGAEGGGDAEGCAVFRPLDEGRAGGIPGSVAAGFKGGAEAAGGEAGGVRLALNQALS